VPLLLAPDVTEIQDSDSVAVHAQPVGEVTFAEPLPPVDTIAWLAGETEYVQVAPACVTAKVRPPAVMLPERCEAFGLAAMLNAIVPAPLPLPPLSIVIHAALADALHEQPFCALIANEPLPPAATRDWLDGLIA
jgi:hypothetical protein